MADLSGRSDFEVELANELSKILAIQRRQIQKMLDAGKDIGADFWTQAAEDMARRLGPLFSRIYIARAEQTLAEGPIGLELGGVNESAVEWATNHAFKLSTELNDTTNRTLQRIISGFFEAPRTSAEIIELLTPHFGPIRAEMIAVTEVTRAAAESERRIAQDIEIEGAKMVPIHITNNDAIVRGCPICWPRHNKEITDDQWPPLHPRCRCWVVHRLQETDEQANRRK